MYSKHFLNGICYYTKGDYKNQPVIFIHGNSLSALTYRNQLNQEKVPVIALDLPGHGNSVTPTNKKETYCISGYVQTINEFIATLNIKEFILAGHSLGGHIAIETAPELEGIKGLLVFGTPPIGIPPEMDKMFLPNPFLPLLFSGVITQEDAENLALQMTSDAELKDEIQKLINDTDPDARIFLGTSVAEGKFKNEKELITNLEIPVWMIHGTNDAFVNYEYLKNICGINPILEIDSGHTPQLERPEQFNQIINYIYSSIFK